MVGTPTQELQRKIGAVMRCLKDSANYMDELTRDRKDLDQMIAENHDRVKQQQQVVKESEAMISVSQNLITKMIDSLETFLKSMESGPSKEDIPLMKTEISNFHKFLKTFPAKTDNNANDINHLQEIIKQFDSQYLVV